MAGLAGASIAAERAFHMTGLSDLRVLAPVVVVLAAALPGCILVGDYDEVYQPAPAALTYEVCYSDFECMGGDSCEELALPAGPHTDFVNAICTLGCFDDLDCPSSPFTGLPGACLAHGLLGGHPAAYICVERCQWDTDCDVAAGFGCALIAGDRLCVPIG